jgi:hypothetical protein
MEPEVSLPCSREPSTSPYEESVQFRGPVGYFVNYFLFSLVEPTLNPQALGPPLVGCQRLLICYIRNYHLYLETVSSIRNLRTRHALVTRNSPNMADDRI